MFPNFSALYHQNGANSSGRSSNCDDGDMQSDVSIEDDVIDLNHKVRSKISCCFAGANL